MKKYILLLFFTVIYSSYGQSSLHITGYDFSGFPEITADFYYFDENGNPGYGITQKDFVVRDNGLGVQSINSLVCPGNFPNEPASVVIVFDLALNFDGTGNSAFETGRELARQLISLADTSRVELSLTSYDVMNYLNREFTKDKNALLAEIDNFKNSSGSVFDTAFFANPAGAFRIAERGVNPKSIIFITDGSGSLNKDEIISRANSENTSVYPVFIGRKASDSFREIAGATGALYLENINPADNPSAKASLLLNHIAGARHCTIQFTTNFDCEDFHDIEINIPASSAKDNFTFDFPNTAKLGLIADTNSLRFSSVQIGDTKRLDVTIVAKNGDVAIEKFEVTPPFYIVGGDFVNFTLTENQFHTLTIEYEPEQEAIVFSELKVFSDACETEQVFMTGGFPNTPPTEKTIRILTPNGGENLIIGQTYPIEWIGLLPQDVIQLEYSSDNGDTWESLVINVNGLSVDWTIPDLPSDSCLIKIYQVWPNNIGFTLELEHTEQVNSAFFNEESSLVITASSDSTVVIWDPNTGSRIHELTEHTKKVVWADFSPDGELAASVGEDGKTLLWNVQTGTLIQSLGESNGRMESVSFSHDGNYLATSDLSGNVRIWNVNTLQLEKLIKSSNGPAWHVDFHPTDSDIIITGNSTREIKIWNWRDHQDGGLPIKEFDSGSLGITHVTFNTDGTKIAGTTSTNNPKVLYVWDYDNPGEPLYSISHNDLPGDNNSINSSSFFFSQDKNKELILTCGTDNTARLWDAANGNPERPNEIIQDNKFVEHSNSVQTAVFDPFGSRVLTSSWDGTAIIWNLNQKELQADLSDSVFSITEAKAIVANEYFEDVATGDVRDSVFTQIIRNQNDFSYEIESLSLEQGTNFSMVSDVEFPIEIAGNSFAEFEFRFLPITPGSFSDNINIKIPGKTVSGSINGNGILRDISRNTRLVDFGDVVIQSFADTVFTALLKSNISSAVNIESIEITGSYSENFKILEGMDIQSASAGTDLDFTIRFVPDTLGRKNAQLVVKYDGLGSPAVINLYGEGVIDKPDTLNISIPDISANTSEEIMIPVIGNYSGTAPAELEIEEYQAHLRFNGTLLYPDFDYDSTWFEGYDRIVRFRVPSAPQVDNKLTELKFRTALGNDSVSALQLENLSPVGNQNIKINIENGLLRLEGLCFDGGARLFDSDGRLSLGNAFPNPSMNSMKFNFEIIENGTSKLYVTDMRGAIVDIILDGAINPGKYEIEYDTGKLPSGKYNYILQTPSNRLVKSFEISK